MTLHNHLTLVKVQEVGETLLGVFCSFRAKRKASVDPTTMSNSGCFAKPWRLQVSVKDALSARAHGRVGEAERVVTGSYLQLPCFVLS